MERDPEDLNREQSQDGGTPETDAPADGPGGDEDGAGSTSQDQPG